MGGNGSCINIIYNFDGTGCERRVCTTAIIQALPPVGETVPSRRHNQTESESGEEANEADTEECRSRLLLFFGLAPTDNTKVMQATGVD